MKTDELRESWALYHTGACDKKRRVRTGGEKGRHLCEHCAATGCPQDRRAQGSFLFRIHTRCASRCQQAGTADSFFLSLFFPLEGCKVDG